METFGTLMFTVWKEGRVAHVRLNPMKALSVGVDALSCFQHRAKTKQMPPVLFSLLKGFSPLWRRMLLLQHKIRLMTKLVKLTKLVKSIKPSLWSTYQVDQMTELIKLVNNSQGETRRVQDQADREHKNRSSPAPGQLVEELLVELLVALLAPHREEDVAADELVDHLAVRGQALGSGDTIR